MRSLRTVVPGASLEVTGGPNRPPLEAAASAALFERARLRSPSGSVCRSRRRPPSAVRSDGNFTAGVGTPTLDGLGAVGGGAHADDEHVLVDALPGRTALLARARRGPAGGPDARSRDDGCRTDHDGRPEASTWTPPARADPGRHASADQAVQAADAAAARPPAVTVREVTELAELAGRGAAVRGDLGSRRQPADDRRAAACLHQGRQLRGRRVRRTTGWSAPVSASSTLRPRTPCTATSPGSSPA